MKTIGSLLRSLARTALSLAGCILIYQAGKVFIGSLRWQPDIVANMGSFGLLLAGTSLIYTSFRMKNPMNEITRSTKMPLTGEVLPPYSPNAHIAVWIGSIISTFVSLTIIANSISSDTYHDYPPIFYVLLYGGFAYFLIFIPIYLFTRPSLSARESQPPLLIASLCLLVAAVLGYMQ